MSALFPLLSTLTPTTILFYLWLSVGADTIPSVLDLAALTGKVWKSLIHVHLIATERLFAVWGLLISGTAQAFFSTLELRIVLLFV